PDDRHPHLGHRTGDGQVTRSDEARALLAEVRDQMAAHYAPVHQADVGEGGVPWHTLIEVWCDGGEWCAEVVKGRLTTTSRRPFAQYADALDWAFRVAT